MAIFYMDPEDGDNAADGLSFANRRRSTLPTLAAGDTVRWIAAPDPVSIGSATWTNDGTITLGSARTVDLYLEGSWTAAPNTAVSAYTPSRKEGVNSAAFTANAGFTTGLANYYATGTKDCSMHDKVFLWFRPFTAVADLSIFQLCLCSDAAGATPVNTLTLPAINAVANQWIPILLDNGGPLGSAIESIAFYTTSDPGTFTWLADNIFATSDISPFSLISKNSSADPDFSAGEEPWWPIRSIVGTTVTLEYGSWNSTNTTVSPGYYGTTESVTTYLLDPLKFLPQAAFTTQIFSNVTNGTAGNPVTFSGGWNRTDMTTQTGLSWMTPENCTGYFMVMGGTRAYQSYEKIGWVRGHHLLNAANGATHILANSCHSISGGDGFNLLSQVGYVTMDNCSGIGGSGVGIILTGTKNHMRNCRAHLNLQRSFVGNVASEMAVEDCLLTDGNTNASIVCQYSNIHFTNCIVARGTRGVYLERSSGRWLDCEVHDGALSAFYLVGGLYNFLNLITSGNTVGFATIGAGNIVHSHNWIYDEVTPATFEDADDQWVISMRDDGVEGAMILRTDNGTIEAQAAIRHTASGVAWQISPTGTIRDADYPLVHKVGYIFVESGVATTVSVWLRRTHADLTGTLRIKGEQLTGITETSSAMTAAADTWEQRSVTFTPTDTGFVDVQIEAYGGTTYSLYWDDLTVSPVSTLDASSGDYGHYQHGVLLMQQAGGGGSPVPKYFPSSR